MFSIQRDWYELFKEKMIQYDNIPTEISGYKIKVEAEAEVLQKASSKFWVSQRKTIEDTDRIFDDFALTKDKDASVKISDNSSQKNHFLVKKLDLENKVLFNFLIFFSKKSQIFCQKKKMIRISDCENKNEMTFIAPTRKFIGIHKRKIFSLDVASNFSYGISSGEDGDVKIWDPKTGKILVFFLNFLSFFFSLIN